MELSAHIEIYKKATLMSFCAGETVEIEENKKILDIKKRKIRKRKNITECAHIHRRHYSKGFCNSCYHLYGRNKKKATKCIH